MNRPASIHDVDLLLFDLDNTLYPRGLGLWREIDERIRLYVGRALNLPPAAAQEVQKRYWQQYGTTIAGLMAEHDLDPAPYLDFVHDVDLVPYLRPNPALAHMLAALPQRKAIFTNATSAHARKVLAALAVAGHFHPIVGFEEVGWVSKPHPQAYERCLALLEVPPQRCLFIEDSANNLGPARAAGMRTVLLGAPADGEADHYIDRIESLGRLFGLNGLEGD